MLLYICRADTEWYRDKEKTMFPTLKFYIFKFDGKFRVAVASVNPLQEGKFMVLKSVDLHPTYARLSAVDFANEFGLKYEITEVGDDWPEKNDKNIINQRWVFDR
jgi:hypothetical protein